MENVWSLIGMAATAIVVLYLLGKLIFSNDDDSRCPKCGSYKCPRCGTFMEDTCSEEVEDTVGGFARITHVSRTCHKCGFSSSE